MKVTLLIGNAILPMRADVCVKCLHTSTSQYHIDVQPVLLEFDKVIHRQYGQSLKGLTSANLCNSCRRYVLQNSISFNDAWPSILSTYWKKSNANHEILKIVELLPLCFKPILKILGLILY